MIPEIPNSLDYNALRRVLVSMRQHIHDLNRNRIRPDSVTNLRVTPLPNGNKVEFTRSGADGYVLLVSPTASWDPTNGGYNLDIGNQNTYTDVVGKTGVQRFYWVVSRKGFGPAASFSDPPSGPVSGTTLAHDAVPALPTQPVPSSSVIGSYGPSGGVVSINPGGLHREYE